jgi:hypothetical protein
MIARVLKLFKRPVPPPVEPVKFDRLALRRANARRYIRIRGIRRGYGPVGNWRPDPRM